MPPRRVRTEAQKRAARERAALRRSQMTPEQREAERARDRERQRQRRAAQSSEQAEQQRMRRRHEDRQARALASEQEREREREAAKLRKREERRRRGAEEDADGDNNPEQNNSSVLMPTIAHSVIENRSRASGAALMAVTEGNPEVSAENQVEPVGDVQDEDRIEVDHERWRQLQAGRGALSSQQHPTETEAQRESRLTSTREQMRARTESQIAERRERKRISQAVRTRLFLLDPTTFLDIGDMNTPCSHCGALRFVTERIKGSSTTSPRFGNCCEGGKVLFSPSTDPPALLRQLLTGTTPRDRRFRKDIRAYNNALSMGSVTAKWVNRGPGTSAFNPTITMHGRIYHYLGAMMPPVGRGPSFLSVYIHDTDYTEQTQHRMNAACRLDANLMQELTAILHDVNPYVHTFRSLREWATGDQTPEQYRMVIHADRRPSEAHRGRYNGPSTSEVAAIIPGSEDGQIGKRDIVLRRIGVLNTNGNEVLDTLSVSHRSYDPLCYVLLFPDGRDGWHPELRQPGTARTRPKISPKMFYAWKLFQRPSEFNILLHSARLFQQYLVDQYAKSEAEKLSYLRENQQRLRASDYSSLREALGDSGRMQDEADVVRAGRLFILPSTHVGGDRYMRQQLHDIIAISNKVGHPDVFLTMTCNPRWPEITRSLLPGQTAQDRPDLCARVFFVKVRALMQFVIEEKYFGEVVAHVRVTEFQKRGLPHVHCIFFLDRPSKQRLNDPLNVDQLISAEIPPTSDPELRDIVLKHAIHTPCDSQNPSPVCHNEEGKCQKHFPKDFTNETGRDENDYYVTYKRRSPQSGGESVQWSCRIGNRSVMREIDNRWVVPYCPAISRMFACHVNAELCISRLGGIKYLFKYVCKGHDRVTVELIGENQRYDEIGNFQDARYISASESVWRLLAYDFVDRNPPVVRLDVHLEGHHTVYFQEDNAEHAANRPRAGTKLTEWFVANQLYPNARHIRYDDFARYFTWNKAQKKWTPRAAFRVRNTNAASSSTEPAPQPQYDFTRPGAHVVSRLYTVSPREGERYYLRVLLLHCPGATSYKHLRTVDGVEHTSFREACHALGLLADDSEWKKALDDAFRSLFVPLSHVFATILKYCSPSDPVGLWEQHKTIFIQDIRHRHRRRDVHGALDSDENALSHVLLEIQTALGRRKLSDYGLPSPPDDLEPLPVHAPAAAQDPAQVQAQVVADISKFNQGQREVFNKVVGAVMPGVSIGNLDGAASSTAPPPLPPSQRVFFLDAPGGTGKTFVTRAIQAFLNLKGKKIKAVASSAVAAQLLDDGRTAHSTFKIPISIDPDSTCNITENSSIAAELREVHLIIWDEIVMCHRYCIEAVDRTLRDIMQTAFPFGGKCVLFSGDFRQILPVIPHGSRPQIVNACVCSSQLFSLFRTLRLTENMRLTALRNDPNADQAALQFPSYLLQVGEGRVPDIQGQRILLPDSIHTLSTIRSLVHRVFANMAENYKDEDWLMGRAILTTKNVFLEEINTLAGALIPGTVRQYKSADQVENENENQLRYPVEMLNTLTAGSALPDHKLLLKRGYPVMLLRNIDTENGHCNGARYIIENMTNNVLFLRLAIGSKKGARLTLPRMPCGPGDPDNFPVPGFTRTQFPVRVCFALTTNKAQGQSFGGKLGLDLREECFSHGQLYVALSRTTHPSNVTICTAKTDRRSRNVIYPEVFSHNTS